MKSITEKNKGNQLKKALGQLTFIKIILRKMLNLL